MDEAGAREALDRVIRRSGETYSSISRLIGRNPSYIQQYIRRGVPGRLEEPDIRSIAHTLGVPPGSIGGLPPLVEPVVAAVSASAPHDYVRFEPLLSRFGRGPVLPAAEAAELASGRIDALAWIQVESDSMEPTFRPGDRLLVDRDDSGARLRDGCYALRQGGELALRRLSIDPARRVMIVADNPGYPVWPAQPESALDVIGRVVWLGRRMW